MRQLTITYGALAMDGGSVSLRATDAAGRTLRILLEWSIEAQRAGATFLTIDGARIQPGGEDEMQWIESLRSARIEYRDASPVTSPPPPCSQPRVILAPDAKAYLEAEGPEAALSVLRDDLLRKLESPLHRRRTETSDKPLQSRPLPLP
jgi:hypothetical protein